MIAFTLVATNTLLFFILVSKLEVGQSLNSPVSPVRLKSASFKQVTLYAKKKKKSNRAVRTSVGNRIKSSSGFGGAAIELCPCGSGFGYMKCCGTLHNDAVAYANAQAEAVVRARYTAYAKREIDFIIGSTHPLNKDFITDIEHWKKTIDANCYDNFELKACEILEEVYEGEGDIEVAKVRFVATMTQVDSREKTSFMETSTFERVGKHIRGDAWMYKSGVVEPVSLENGDTEPVEVNDVGNVN